MNGGESEQSGGPSRWLALLGIPFAAIGFGICVGVAVNEGEDLAAAQLGYEIFLQSVGAMVICVGLFGLVLEVLGSRRTRTVLVQTLLITVGLAVYVRDGWSLIGLALVLASIVVNEYLSGKYRRDGDQATR